DLVELRCCSNWVACALGHKNGTCKSRASLSLHYPSMTRTVTWVFSDNLFATTSPPAPPDVGRNDQY
ncbi:aryl-alcohol oxidase, partial [Moniliophthora roreri]